MNKFVLICMAVLFCSHLHAANLSAGDQKKAGEASQQVIIPDDIWPAVNAGHFKQILAWIDEDPKRINAQSGHDGYTLLNVVVDHRYDDKLARLAFIKELLARNANVNLANNQGNTPLHQAEDVEILRLLLERGADVHAKNKEGQTPLDISISACEEKGTTNLEKIKLLIEHGADVNSFIRQPKSRVKPKSKSRSKYPQSRELSYLTIAISNNCLPLAQLLLEQGADPETVEGNERSVMFYAESPEAVKLLQEFIEKREEEQIHEAGKTIEKITGHSTHAVKTTLQQFFSEAEGLKPINQIKKVIREGYADREGNQAELRALVMEGNNLELTDETGYTPLMLAVESNEPEFVKLLLALEQEKISGTNDAKQATELRAAAVKNKENARVIAEKYGFKDIVTMLKKQ